MEEVAVMVEGDNTTVGSDAVARARATRMGIGAELTSVQGRRLCSRDRGGVGFRLGSSSSLVVVAGNNSSRIWVGLR